MALKRIPISFFLIYTFFLLCSSLPSPPSISLPPSPLPSPQSHPADREGMLRWKRTSPQVVSEQPTREQPCDVACPHDVELGTTGQHQRCKEDSPNGRRTLHLQLRPHHDNVHHRTLRRTLPQSLVLPDKRVL